MKTKTKREVRYSVTHIGATGVICPGEPEYTNLKEAIKRLHNMGLKNLPVRLDRITTITETVFERKK